jgi:hypothetical protein
MKTIFKFSILILLCLCTACGAANPSAAVDPASGPAAWIDAPLDGSSLPLAAYQLVSHASDTSGITSFELSVDGQVLHTDAVAADQAGSAIAHVSQSWQPEKPGVYLLSVRAANQSGVFGPAAYARVTIGRVPEMAAASPTPIAVAVLTATPTFENTATITATPTSSVPVAIGLVNTNCHDGPGGAYRSRDVLMQAQSAPIDGVNAALTWVRVRRPDGANGYCWLSVSVIQVIGNLSNLPVLAAPTLPPEDAPGPTGTAPAAATRAVPTRAAPTPVPPVR